MLQRICNSELVKFLLAGGTATAVQYATLVLLVELAALNPVFASVVGYTAGAVVNYLLNYYFTFLSNSRHLLTALKFAMVVLSGLGINALIMYTGIELLQLHYILSQAIATLLILVWNFFAHKLWTYSLPASAVQTSRN